MSDRPAGEGSVRAAGGVGLGTAVLAAGLALWLAGPPAPLPADAPADRFAAGRALADVAELAQAPRPVGSAAHEAARAHLLQRMAALGLEAETHETTVARWRGENRLRVARVRNLVGRLPGGGERGAVLLVAHYDSRPNTPGAGDDAAGVAVALETVRALAGGAPLERDLIVLLSDAEELGLLGARGFAAEHPWMEEVELVLNFEARGSRGPAVMFETGRGDLELVRAFARAAPRPLATSLSAEVYARMPNDTDFSELRARGASGLNFAFLGGFAAYHTALDRIERLDPASLQHAGDSAVASIRHLDATDLPARGATGLWFNPLGGWLLVLGAGAALPVAAALALLAVGLAVFGVRRGRIAWRGLRGGALQAVAALLLVPSAGALLWKLFADNAPALLDTPHRLPHRLELTGLALALAGLAAVAVLCGFSAPRRPVEVTLGTAIVWSVLGLVAAALLPGASFLFWWPLWGLVAAAAIVLTRQPPRPLAILLLSLGALPGVAMLAPLALLVLQAMTPHLAIAALAPAGHLVVLLLPALVALAGQRQGLSLVALVASLAVLAASVWGTPDARRPRTADLVHLQDLDSGAAYWLSRDERPASWVLERLGEDPQPWKAPSYLAAPERPILRGDAPPVAGVSGPEALEVEDLREEGRRVTLRLRSPSGAPVLHVEAASTVPVDYVELAGQRFERPGDEATKPLRLELVGLPPEGLEVGFHLPDRWPVELHLTEQHYGLSGVGPLPPGLIPTDAWTSHSRLVHRSFLR